MTALEPNSETDAFLAMAQKLRRALTDRNEFVSSYRERYDQAQDDVRIMPDKHSKVAAEFLQAVYKADHRYEDRLAEALEEYREIVTRKEEIRP